MVCDGSQKTVKVDIHSSWISDIGLLAYAVKACGEDFIAKIQSGEVT